MKARDEAAGRASSRRDAAWQALRRRFPRPSGSALAYQSATIVLGNAYLVLLAAQGRLRPLSLVAFNVAELVVLGLIGRAALLAVPRVSRLASTDADSAGSRVFIGFFALLWLSGVYVFAAFLDAAQVEAVRHAAGPLDALALLGIGPPLLLSASLGVIAMIGDWSFWHRSGGLFVPEMAVSTVPKLLTLFLAPIPSAMAAMTFLDEDAGFAAFAWVAAYLVIKCLVELAILAGLWLAPSRLPAGAPAASTGPVD